MAEVVTLRRRSNDHSDYPADQVFFTKWQIAVGAELISIGRIDRGLIWRVVKIMSYPQGRIRGLAVQSVRQMRDAVYLQCPETGDTRIISFGSLCYSAKWQIANWRGNALPASAAE
jgi:hypothetical protein